MRSISYIL